MDGEGQEASRKEGRMSQGRTEGLVGRERFRWLPGRKGTLGTSTLRRIFSEFSCETHTLPRALLSRIPCLLWWAVTPHWYGVPCKGKRRPLLVRLIECSAVLPITALLCAVILLCSLKCLLSLYNGRSTPLPVSEIRLHECSPDARPEWFKRDLIWNNLLKGLSPVYKGNKGLALEICSCRLWRWMP